MSTRVLLMVTLLVSALVLAACGSAPAATPPAPSPAPPAEATPAPEPEAEATPVPVPPPADLAGTSWLLSELAGNPPVASDREPAELVFEAEDSRVAGSSGCNRFFGGFTVEGETITFGVLGSTMMACEEDAMQQEQTLFSLMAQVTSYSLTEDTLTFTTADGTTIVFTRA